MTPKIVQKLQSIQSVGFSAVDTVKELCKEYKLTPKQHPKYPHLYQFKYDQLESDFREEIVREARGIILDSSDNWKVVARSFDKFFNEGEQLAAPIDWKSAKVQEKLDGSLIILYWYEDAWQVATSGTPDASGTVNGFDFTFAELFWKTINKQEMHIKGNIFDDRCGVGCMGLSTTVWDAFARLDDHYSLKNYTWMWELTSPYNRIVVQHKEPRVTLIGIRSTETGNELPYGAVSSLPIVKEFPLTNLEEIVKTFPTMEPTTQEGYVVVDKDFNRIKIKNPAYVALHHAKDGFGPRRMLSIAVGGEQAEWLAYFPEFKDAFEEIKRRLDTLIRSLEEAWEKNKHIADQKEFALQVKGLPCCGALFAMKRGKVKSVRESVVDMTLANLADTLHIKDVVM